MNDASAPAPLVTVGMPVYNGAATLASAIESILTQTHSNIEFIISDNASTDGTEGICRAFVARDPRIRYVRQPENIGADANFDFVLQQARTDYFMWAAADDSRSPDFIEANLAFLEAHPGFVGSTCRVRFAGEGYDPVRMGDETRDEDSVGLRILRFFDTWHANGRCYSLFRTSALRQAKEGIDRFLASDWVVVIRLLAHGRTKRLDLGSVDLRRGGASHARDFMASFRVTPAHWILPLLEVSRIALQLVRDQPLRLRLRVFQRLAHLNLLGFVAQVRFEIARIRHS